MNKVHYNTLNLRKYREKETTLPYEIIPLLNENGSHPQRINIAEMQTENITKKHHPLSKQGHPFHSSLFEHGLMFPEKEIKTCTGFTGLAFNLCIASIIPWP